ncbi:hypothetical protein HRbin30_00785 [bacterium HR30]|nr:hypothetical protein HRbin30_00785 [bacterium HR30]
MDADTLLGLQQAHADVSRLADEARMLAPLRDWIEGELTRQLDELSRHLRYAQRRRADEPAISAFAQQLQQLQEQIRHRTQEVRSTSRYREALAALHEERFRDLERILPTLFSDLEPAARPPRLLVPFDLEQQRRRPGTAPFLTPSQVAERIATIASEGLVPQGEPGPPWLADFPYLWASARPEDLASPVWFVFDGPVLPAAVLSHKSEPGTFRIYAARLRGVAAIGIAERAEDEWWLAQEPTYERYRLLLAAALRERGLTVEGVD